MEAWWMRFAPYILALGWGVHSALMLNIMVRSRNGSMRLLTEREQQRLALQEALVTYGMIIWSAMLLTLTFVWRSYN